MKRRVFLKHAGLAIGAGIVGTACRTEDAPTEPSGPLFGISLAQWSVHRAIRGGQLAPLNFPVLARQEFGIEAIEYVNTLFEDKRTDTEYLQALKARCDGEGVRSLLIMCDGEGYLGDPDAAARNQAAQNHHRWVEAAKFLGCHSIRVNAQSSGPREEQARLAADGLRQLCEWAEPHAIDIIVENHGGLSSDGSWLADVMNRVDHPRVGTLPDFGNFQVSESVMYDRYLGVEELMPFARAVSAKSHEFDADGLEVRTDYMRMMRIVLDSGYRGYVGIEYEGEELAEYDGIRATKTLMERARATLAPDYS